jgi:hypothetical protein
MDTIGSQIEHDARAQIAGDPRIPYPTTKGGHHVQ